MNHVRIAHWLDGSWAYSLALSHDTTLDQQWWPGFSTPEEALRRGVADLDHARAASHQYFVHLGVIWFQYYEARRGFGLMSMQERDKAIDQLRWRAANRPDLLEPPAPRPIERGRVEKHVPPPTKVRIKLNLEALR